MVDLISQESIYIPIYQELIDHVRILDGFNEQELCKLKSLLFGIAELELILSLVNVDFTEGSQKTIDHLNKILEQMKSKGGLDYLPRERTPQGRVFDHASDCKILLKHLKTMTRTSSESKIKLDKPLFYIKLANDPQDMKRDESISTGISSLWEEEKEEIFQIKQNFINFILKANGKADIYFHAYFWLAYLQSLYLRAYPENKEENFDKDIVQTNPELLRLKGLAESLRKVAANINKFGFKKEQYEKYVENFGGRKQVKKQKLLEDLHKSLFIAQLTDDQDSLFWIEKILIQLLGYYEISVRDQAVVFLNMLYDGIDWQLTQAFKPVIRCIGQHFKVNVLIDHEMIKNKFSQIFLGLSAPSPIEGQNQSILTWHKIDERNILKSERQETEISINFGKFWKCGFYDWRLVVIKEDGRLQTLEVVGQPQSIIPKFNKQNQDYYDQEDEQVGQQAQGRFIVHAKGMKDHIFHEVQVDFQNAEVDSKQGKFIKRGNFETVQNNIDNYKQRGITALYLMGVLERDNYPFLNKMTNEVEYRKPDASALAITCRQTANKMLGGDTGFQKVITQAKKSKMKIIIDCLARISSSRNHRKYRGLLLYHLDEDGKRKICYGTDGQAINYEDSAMLNYRKVEAWNLLISEVVSFAKKYQIDGIHLDNGQAWPQIMETDMEELMRLDVDGQAAYSALDLMNGEIVLRNENFGYWNTNTMEQYANPFFIKMCKTLWTELPNFMIIGECWGGFMFENRQIILARSGIIPRMYKLPQAISLMFSKKLYKDGRVQKCERENVLALKKWYEESRQFLPQGTILLQSSSAHVWPYPAYLYGKGTWAAVDILHFMPDIPITFMGEIDGEVFRIGTSQIFQHEQQEVKTGGFKRSNSQLAIALSKNDEEDNLAQKTPNKSDRASTPERRGLVKVRSGSDLSAVLLEQKHGVDLKHKEEKFKAEIGPIQGFDLRKISTHYEHRRRLRREKMVLRYGELVPLAARNDKGWESQVLTFARYSLYETAIIATNLNEKETTFWVDLTSLQPYFQKSLSKNTVVMISNWLKPDSQPEYYMLNEFLNMKNIQTLKPYHSSMISISACQDDNFVLKKALTQSVERTKLKLQRGESIESEQISLLFSEIIEKEPENICKFANIVGSLQENFLDKMLITFKDLVLSNHKFRNDPILASRIMALCTRIVEICEDIEIPPKKAAQSLVEFNKLGPIVFCTPELGRWSTVGGLGVMVDELSYGLSLLGQDVWVISPYYERNRKGETGYLAKDPAGIIYKENLNVSIESGITLGVHEGVVNNVKVVFLHNAQIFPTAYSDSGPYDIVKQMAVFGKGCLEFCCKRKIIPSVCVTNDWFTGLIPGYSKIKAFGDTFSGTTFFHIVHNLEPTYEGRIFPPPNMGAMENLHQLPREWLVDPYWERLMINPSRCAIMLSDQWGTVSPSYKEDLLRESPLQNILKQKPKPFAFPNGIPVQARIKKLNEVAPDHLTAKKLIQMKYFGYQELDDSVPLLAFVGRITSQKGVHLILEAAEHLINENQYKINILVGGAANMKDPYSAGCAHKMWHLKHKYPNQFWAAPNDFFTDGSLVNRGTDFGLMPSKFEPGGIVQHEFFVGGTPVIAFKTGGLKDSVTEFMWDSEQGNGYTFENHSVTDFIYACKRALGTFKNKSKYAKLRENSFTSVMDGSKVSKAWLAEFHRLRGKIFVDEDIVRDCLNKVHTWSPKAYKPMHSFEEMLGIERNINFHLEDIDLGAEEEKEVFEEEKNGSKKVLSHFEHPPKDEKFPHVFMMHNKGPRYNQVQLCGSFDNWQSRYNMSYDDLIHQWFITLHLQKGKYYYKYIVNGNNWIVNDKEPNEKDQQGNINNVLVLQ